MIQNRFKDNVKGWIESNYKFVFGDEQRDISVTEVYIEEQVRL